MPISGETPSLYGLPAGELLPGEQVLWSGRPTPGGFRSADVRQLGILVFILVIYGVLAAHAGSLPGPIRVVAFLTGGIGGLGGVGYAVYFTVLQRRFRRRDAYAVTTWRVIAAPGQPGTRPCSAWLDQVASVSEQGRHDGVASLAISGPATAAAWPGRRESQFTQASRPEYPQLHDLADAAVARDALAQARARMKAGEPRGEPPQPGPTATPTPAAVTLAPGERLLWTGRPTRVPAWFGWSDLWVSGFGLVMLAGFGTFAALPTALDGGNVVFFAFVIAFGLYLALGRVLYRWLRIRRAVYVLTSRRLIVTWGRAVAASDLRDLLPAQVSGTSVISRPVAPVAIRGWGGWRLILTWPATIIVPPVLAGLADPVAVRDLVRRAQLAARQDAGRGAGRGAGQPS